MQIISISQKKAKRFRNFQTNIITDLTYRIDLLSEFGRRWFWSLGLLVKNGLELGWTENTACCWCDDGEIFGEWSECGREWLGFLL